MCSTHVSNNFVLFITITYTILYVPIFQSLVVLTIHIKFLSKKNHSHKLIRVINFVWKKNYGQFYKIIFY
jgi:hypothetical protein